MNISVNTEHKRQILSGGFMTDKRIKEGCPMCGTPANEIQIITFTKGLNKIECPKCNLTFNFVGGKQELIDKWNCRYK